MSYQEAEGLAAYVLEQEGYGYPVSPWDVAAVNDHRVEFGEPRGRPHVRRWKHLHIITLDPCEPARRLATTTCHESSHIFCEQHRIPSDDQHAWWVAGGILLPRHIVSARLRAGLGIEEMVDENPFISHELAARRVVGMRDSLVLQVWDVEPQPNRYRIVSPGWRWPRRTTQLEQETMDASLESRCPIELVGGVRAWTVEEHGYVRTLCLSDAEVLMPHIG